jgi:hypothetical protein
MSIPTRNPGVAAVLLVVLPMAPALVSAFECTPPLFHHPEQRLTLCSPQPTVVCVADTMELRTNIVPAGLEVSFCVPPRDQTTFVSEIVAPTDGAWSDLQAGETVPGLSLTGTYMGVLDQRIEIAILQIGAANVDSGVVGVDEITVSWSSVFRPRRFPEADFRAPESGTFQLDSTNVGRPLQLVVQDPNDETKVDTVNTAGLRLSFEGGQTFHKGWTAVFDVEDFEGFWVWRWLSDPTTEAVAVGSYNKLKDSDRPGADWTRASPTGTRFTFVDRFAINGNTYHYAVQSFDNGFNTRNGELSNDGPFDSPLPPATSMDQLGSTQIRVDFLRPPPEQFVPVQAVPNPFRQSECDPAEFATTCTVRFINLPPRGTLLIYTLAGDLVREFNHPENLSAGDVPGTLRWDTLNGAREPIASGIYIFKIIDLESGQQSFGRLAVIR